MRVPGLLPRDSDFISLVPLGIWIIKSYAPALIPSLYSAAKVQSHTRLFAKNTVGMKETGSMPKIDMCQQRSEPVCQMGTDSSREEGGCQ